MTFQKYVPVTICIVVLCSIVDGYFEGNVFCRWIFRRKSLLPVSGSILTDTWYLITIVTGYWVVTGNYVLGYVG